MLDMLRKVRVITNPPVSVKEPFVFDRKDGNYSAVEKKTLAALGKERLDGWKITAERQRIVPERVRIQERMKMTHVLSISDVDAQRIVIFPAH